MAGRKALLVATYAYSDGGLSRLTAPGRDAEALAEVLGDPTVAGFDVTVLVNQPTHVVGEAIADFYRDCRRDDLTLLYFSGHGLKDDSGRLYLAMTNTRRDALLFTGLSAALINDAMEACVSRRKVLILDCCYSGAFPAGSAAKSDATVNALERFQGKGRAVLTASDATQYSFEGESVEGTGVQSLFTRYLVEAIRTGEADLDADGDIALDELYSYVHERVVAEMPQQRPKKQEDVDGRILIARNVHWMLPAHLRNAVDSPIAAQRLSAIEGLAHLHRMGNDMVRAVVAEQLAVLADDDSRAVSAAASALRDRLAGEGPGSGPPTREPAGEPADPAARRATAPVVVEAAPRVEAPPSVAAVSPVPSPRPPAEVPGPEPPGTSHGRDAGVRRTAVVLLALVAVGAVVLTLSRTLVFVASYDDTAEQFYDSTVPWIGAVVLPLAAAATLLVLSWNSDRAVPWAVGLLAGLALVLTSQVIFWGANFAASSSYTPGAAYWCLIAGWVVIGAAAVLAWRAAPLGGRPTLVRDWRVVWAFAVLVCLSVSVGTGADESTPAAWLAKNAGALVLAAGALPLTLLHLGGGRRVSGLVAIVVLGAWTVFFPVRALFGGSDFSSERPGAGILAACTVVTVIICFVAQEVRPRHREPAPAGAAPAG